MLIAGYDTPLNLLKLELVQLSESGYTVPPSLKARIEALHPVYDAYNDSLQHFYDELQSLERSADYPYVEPDDLADIRRERPAGPRQLALQLTEAELIDRWHGAWSGRSAGCALGQVVEGWSDAAIKEYLQKIGDWPLTEYISRRGLEPDSWVYNHQSVRENIDCMGPDDDIHYTLIGLKVLEQYGRDFQWNNVADTWNDSLPYNQICTAETQAVLNYNLRRTRADTARKSAATKEFTRRFNNPYREWIGAQIRADFWGYINPGNPELAAEYAWRDASWTHVANGIYGEMMMAAIIAASFVETDFERLVEIGLSEIPANCRLAAAVREALDWLPECPTFEHFMVKLNERYAAMHPVHTINNALIVIMSLYYGRMNPDRSLCIAVMAGKDTDCNGATVGSIVGAVHGRRNFGGKLLEPLHDLVKPLVFGFQEITMRALAERTAALYRKFN